MLNYSMQQPATTNSTPQTPQTRDNSPYTQLLVQPNINNNYPAHSQHMIQPNYNQVVPEGPSNNDDGALQNLSDHDKCEFVLKITCIFLGQLFVQLMICWLLQFYSESGEWFYIRKYSERTPWFYCTLVGIVICIFGSNAVLEHREPNLSYALISITTISTGLFQLAGLSPIFRGPGVDFWVWLGCSWFILSTIGFFSLISVAIFLKKEKNQICPKVAYKTKYMYILPACMTIISTAIGQHIIVFAISLVGFFVVGSIYGFYYLTMIGRMVNINKHKFDKSEFVQAAILLNRDQILPCL